MLQSERIISVYFSESCAPLPIKIYPETPEEEILIPITESISNVLLSYSIKENEYEIFDKKTHKNIFFFKDLSNINEIFVRFLNKDTLKKVTFIQDDLYSSQMLNQLSTELKTKKSFQLDRDNIQNNQNNTKTHKVKSPSLPFEELKQSKKSSHNFQDSPLEKNKKEVPIIQKPVEKIQEVKKVDAGSRKHPFFISGKFQTVSEIQPNSQILTDKKGVGFFSFLPFDTPFNQDTPPPTYLEYSVWKKLKGISKEEIIAGMERLPSGELKCVDKATLDNQKGLVGEMIKKIMQSIAEGRGIVGVSLPCRIFEPRSLLERIVDWWGFAPNFLNKAATSQDPVLRMKFIIAFSIAGLYVSVSQVKPFNPLLGETYQAAFPDGTAIYCEHTNHHPPISNFLIVAKNYRFYGRYEYIAKPNTTFNELKMFQEGPNIVEFGKDDKVEFNLPGGKLTGLMAGDRVIKWHGIMKFIDKKNSLKAILKIGSDKKVGGGGLFSKKRSDLMEGKLYYFKKDPKPNEKKKSKKDQEKDDLKYLDMEQEIGVIEGSWLDNLVIGNEEIWNINKMNPVRQIPEENPLPSDCRFREDLLYLKTNDLKLADKWKVLLEVRQRYEKKLRIENAKNAKKKK